MKKSVAGQVIGAQMLTLADGTNFTGAVTVYVTGDSGTQTIGSVGSGICTHEGLGYHSYAPAQAETNFDHIAFTFEGVGAITTTLQVYTAFPQTGDTFPFGAPPTAGAIADVVWDESNAAHVAAGSTGESLSNAGGGSTPADIADAVWDELLAGHTAAGSAGEFLAASGTAADPWLATLPGAYGAGTAGEIVGTTLDAAISTRATPADVQAELVIYGALRPLVPGRTLDVNPAGEVDANVVGATLVAMQDFADALLNRDFTLVSDTNARTLLNAARYLRNKRAIVLGTLTVTKENDTTAAWTAATVGTPGAPPISSVDPA